MAMDDLVVPAGMAVLVGFSMLGGGSGNLSGMLSGGQEIKQLRTMALILRRFQHVTALPISHTFSRVDTLLATTATSGQKY